MSSVTHHSTCEVAPDGENICTILVRNCGEAGITALVDFGTGERILATGDEPDIGFTEPHTILHDVAHTILACLLGLDGSPVLKRVAELIPLSQHQVDLEEEAVFAIQRFVGSLSKTHPEVPSCE